MFSRAKVLLLDNHTGQALGLKLQFLLSISEAFLGKVEIFQTSSVLCMRKIHNTVENYLEGGKKSLLEPNLRGGCTSGVGSADIQVFQNALNCSLPLTDVLGAP